MSDPIGEIVNERERQQSVEGWTPAHDDLHNHAQLAQAAACYAYPGTLIDEWPWDDEWDKRAKHDRRRQLVIAGALIVAEIDRLDRAKAKEVRGE